MDSIVAGTVVAILAAPLVVVLFYVGATLVVLPLTGESIFRFTDRALVDEILALVPMRPGQRFYDLGCGEGRVLIAARRKYGVHAIGYEVNVCAYLYARLNIWWHGGGAEVRFRNFMHVDLSDADVIYCYQASGAIQQLRDKFNRELRPGTIVISNTYTIERWLTPTVVTLAHGIITRNIYLYQVPSS
ncbi:MAG: class I SAM-dependent methyltransferase, partial [candidate division NC10 bacterium]|nr:class I SAM-dependent methyltransferase [candidate division NC10 bacterium]